MILEHLEYGKKFDISDFISGRKMITNLYNDKMDKLTVKISGSDIYFEELLHEPIEYEDFYITQLFHIETYQKGEKLFIKHFDHEYIKYNLDEFCIRLDDPEQRGKKVKTFKIDNAEIPFFINFIIAPLVINFRNKSLLKEYFLLDEEN